MISRNLVGYIVYRVRFELNEDGLNSDSNYGFFSPTEYLDAWKYASDSMPAYDFALVYNVVNDDVVMSVGLADVSEREIEIIISNAKDKLSKGQLK